MRFLNCCSSPACRQSAWVLQPAKISVLNSLQSLFKLLVFVPFVNIPKLLKFSIIIWMQLLGFSPVQEIFHMRVCAKKNQFAGIFATGPTVHVRQSDMWMQQAGNNYSKTGQFGSLFGLLKLIKKQMGGNISGRTYWQSQIALPGCGTYK
jgi:hypothetical protein